jgi:hypothetical protein
MRDEVCSKKARWTGETEDEDEQEHELEHEDEQERQRKKAPATKLRDGGMGVCLYPARSTTPLQTPWRLAASKPSIKALPQTCTGVNKKKGLER